MSINCPKCGIILGESDWDENLGECDKCGRTYTIEQVIAEKDKEINALKKELTTYKDYHRCASSVISDLQGGNER